MRFVFSAAFVVCRLEKREKSDVVALGVRCTMTALGIRESISFSRHKNKNSSAARRLCRSASTGRNTIEPFADTEFAYLRP